MQTMIQFRNPDNTRQCSKCSSWANRSQSSSRPCINSSTRLDRIRMTAGSSWYCTGHTIRNSSPHSSQYCRNCIALQWHQWSGSLGSWTCCSGFSIGLKWRWISSILLHRQCNWPRWSRTDCSLWCCRDLECTLRCMLCRWLWCW